VLKISTSSRIYNIYILKSQRLFAQAVGKLQSLFGLFRPYEFEIAAQACAGMRFWMPVPPSVSNHCVAVRFCMPGPLGAREHCADVCFRLPICLFVCACYLAPRKHCAGVCFPCPCHLASPIHFAGACLLLSVLPCACKTSSRRSFLRKQDGLPVPLGTSQAVPLNASEPSALGTTGAWPASLAGVGSLGSARPGLTLLGSGRLS
jgi:hypothetical protein